MINALTTTTTTATDDNNHKGDKKDNYPQILNEFHNILNNAIPNNGINKDDEILFYYCRGSSSDGDSLSTTSSLSPSSIAILINNKYIDTIHDALLLRYQLLSIYIGPQSITPEAAKVIKQRYVIDSV